MTFTSLTFIIFLVIVFSSYWSVRGVVARNIVMAVASYIFYGWWDWRFCGLMFASTIIDFVLALAIARASTSLGRKLFLTASVVSNLTLLGFFKYFNFFADSFTTMANSIGWPADPVTLNVVLPVGISFYTFQTLSYSIDVYRGKIAPTRDYIAYTAYVSSFPQLVAGPIERGAHLLPQFLTPRQFNYDQACDGCRQILWGFFKKMVVADQLAEPVDMVFSDIDGASGPQIAFATVCFAFQIYCDFSAYSDIAIGTGRLFGLDLMRNFAYPYFSESITEFWRRWHISLSTWFRDYVYIPLGGSHVSRSRMAFNIMLTFIISGFWHGAAWTFIIWGALMGAFLLPEALAKQDARKVHEAHGTSVLRILRTFGLICIGWIFFRAASLTDAVNALEKIVVEVVKPEAWARLGGMLSESEGRGALVLITSIVIWEWIQRHHPHPLIITDRPRWVRWIVYTILIWVTLYVGPVPESRFIYFQF